MAFGKLFVVFVIHLRLCALPGGWTFRSPQFATAPINVWLPCGVLRASLVVIESSLTPFSGKHRGGDWASTARGAWTAAIIPLVQDQPVNTVMPARRGVAQAFKEQAARTDLYRETKIAHGDATEAEAAMCGSKPSSAGKRAPSKRNSAGDRAVQPSCKRSKTKKGSGRVLEVQVSDTLEDTHVDDVLSPPAVAPLRGRELNVHPIDVLSEVDADSESPRHTAATTKSRALHVQVSDTVIEPGADGALDTRNVDERVSSAEDPGGDLVVGQSSRANVLKLLPPGGDIGGRMLVTSRAELHRKILQRAGPGKGCWRKECKLECRRVVREYAHAFAQEFLAAWNCSATAQDMVMSGLLQRHWEAKSLRSRPTFAICGIRVCHRGLCRALGVGTSRCKRLKANRGDLRRLKTRSGPPRSEAWSNIYGHLWHVYESVAEFQPDKPLLVDGNPMQELDGRALQAHDAFLAEVTRAGCFGEAGAPCLTPSEDLPRKQLPPGCPKDHWWAFLATPGMLKYQKSYSTFKRVWRSCFVRLLCFANFATHACCSSCSKLRAEIQKASDMATKLRVSEEYRNHLQRQWRDRLLYWRMRSLSRTRSGLWLCIIMDGADQAKFRVLKAARWPSEFDGKHRPKVQLVGCHAHGHECSFNIREEDVDKGSDFSIEVLARCLSRALQACEEEGSMFPEHLWVQTDNATGEYKHQWTARFFALLVGRGIFRRLARVF